VYRKKQIAKRLANELRIPDATAADQVDRAVDDILRKVRRGEKATLPGIGVLSRKEKAVKRGRQA
jgi:nucleoid DNA-binding protein